MRDSPLGRIRLNRIVNDLVAEYLRIRNYNIDLLMADGAPPFTDPISESEQRAVLLNWRDLGDPRYWESPAAQHRLSQLESTLGGAPPVAPQALQPQEVLG